MRVGVGAVPLDDLGQMDVQVKHEVDEVPDEIHVLPMRRAAASARALVS